MNQKNKLILKSVFVLIMFAGSIQVLATWSNPPVGVTPPAGNTEAPINVGPNVNGVPQYKAGGIVADGIRAALSFITDATSTSTFNGSALFNSTATFNSPQTSNPVVSITNTHSGTNTNTKALSVTGANIYSSPSSRTSIAGYFKGGNVNNVLFNSYGLWVDKGTGTNAYSAYFNGPLKIVDGTQGTGKVLTSDAAGLASWVTPTAGTSSQWTTSGSNIYYNGGNVGIGASPDMSLPTGTAGFSGLNIASPIIGALKISKIGDADTLFLATNGSTHYLVGYGNVPLLFYTNGAEKMRITGTGDVGIGTNAPGAKLEVNGQVKITGGCSGNVCAGKVLTSDASGLASWVTPISTNVGSGTANYVAKWSATPGTLADSIISDNGTNVGIGIPASGGYKLDVAGYTHIANTNPGTVGLLLQTANGDTWFPYTDGRNYIRGTTIIADLGGNVGIGTNAPGAKLEVNGQVKITGGTPGVGKVLTSDASGLASWVTPISTNVGSGTANRVAKWSATTPGTLADSIISDNGTNVGIGIPASGGYKLDVAGYTHIANTNPGTVGLLLQTANGDTWFPYTDGRNYIRGTTIIADLGGNVGIGTSSTINSKLFVAGGGYHANTGANNAAYALGAESIAANDSIYSYGAICAGNSAGNCLGTGGTVITGSGINMNGTILSSGTTGNTPTSGAGTRLMWVPAKSAFRVGSVTGTQWNNINVGDYSIALGYNTKASALRSVALGQTTTASGINSTAMGSLTIASGDNSFASGAEAQASGMYSTSMGFGGVASGMYSTSMGFDSVASGESSTAIGFSTASGKYSTSMGMGTTASGNWSTAMGWNTTASGDLAFSGGDYSIASGTGSTAIGYEVKAESYFSTVIGRSNVGGGTATTWVSTDPLFEIGNGTEDPYVKSNAFTVYKNGNAKLAGTLTQSSSRRYKTDIENYYIDKTKVLGLNPSTYVYKTDTDKVKQIGLIAEDVAKIVPEIVSYDKEGRPDSLNYSALSVILLDVVKQQQKEIDISKEETSFLKQEINLLKQEVELLKNK